MSDIAWLALEKLRTRMDALSVEFGALHGAALNAHITLHSGGTKAEAMRILETALASVAAYQKPMRELLEQIRADSEKEGAA